MQTKDFTEDSCLETVISSWSVDDSQSSWGWYWFAEDKKDIWLQGGNEYFLKWWKEC